MSRTPYSARSGRLIAGLVAGVVLSLALTFMAPRCQNFEDYILFFIPIGGTVGMLGALLGAAFGRYGWKSILLALSSALGVGMISALAMFFLSMFWVESKEMSGLVCMLYGMAAGILSMPPAFAGLLLIIHKQIMADRAVVAQVRSRRLNA